jgi:hypothetical protein
MRVVVTAQYTVAVCSRCATHDVRHPSRGRGQLQLLVRWGVHFHGPLLSRSPSNKLVIILVHPSTTLLDVLVQIVNKL